jgi:cell wall-associated NlpC family hydrolase
MRDSHQIQVMSIRLQTGVLALSFGLVSFLCLGLQVQGETSRSSITKGANGNHARKADRTLSPDDGMAVISAALDSKARTFSGRDCSHLVHAIYERAGFPYAYVSSYDLYDGAEEFQRVWNPQPGDLIVWRGHVGIVVRPSRHVFYSFLRSGPTTDNYESPYWVSRGGTRFYRYIKHVACSGCTSVSRTLP